MTFTLRSEKLAAMVQHQRANRPFREVAAELGDVSASTLYRLEAGKWPDMPVFLSVCRWLKVSPNQFFHPVKVIDDQPEPVGYAQGQLIDLVRSDHTLKPITANVLTVFIQAAYQTNLQ